VSLILVNEVAYSLLKKKPLKTCSLKSNRCSLTLMGLLFGVNLPTNTYFRPICSGVSKSNNFTVEI
jgi:hypothetical protein